MGIGCMTQGTQTGALSQPRGVGCGGRWEGSSRGRRQDIYIPVADSCRYLAEKNKIL